MVLMIVLTKKKQALLDMESGNLFSSIFVMTGNIVVTFLIPFNMM